MRVQMAHPCRVFFVLRCFASIACKQTCRQVAAQMPCHWIGIAHPSPPAAACRGRAGKSARPSLLAAPRQEGAFHLCGAAQRSHAERGHQPAVGIPPLVRVATGGRVLPHAAAACGVSPSPLPPLVLQTVFEPLWQQHEQGGWRAAFGSASSCALPTLGGCVSLRAAGPAVAAPCATPRTAHARECARCRGMVSPFKVAREAILDRSAGAAKFLGEPLLCRKSAAGCRTRSAWWCRAKSYQRPCLRSCWHWSRRPSDLVPAMLPSIAQVLRWSPKHPPNCPRALPSCRRILDLARDRVQPVPAPPCAAAQPCGAAAVSGCRACPRFVPPTLLAVGQRKQAFAARLGLQSALPLAVKAVRSIAIHVQPPHSQRARRWSAVPALTPWPGTFAAPACTAGGQERRWSATRATPVRQRCPTPG